MTAREEALVSGSGTEEEVIRLDLLESEASTQWQNLLSGATRRRDRRSLLLWLALGLAGTDAACLAAAVWTAGQMTAAGGDRGPTVLLLAGAALVWGAVFCAHGLYRPLHLGALDEFRRVLSAVSVGVLVLGCGAVAFGLPVSPAWLPATWLAVLGLEIAGRTGWRRLLQRSRREGALRSRTLIVGGTREADRLAAELVAGGSGYELLGHVAEDGGLRDGKPVLGGIEDLTPLIRRLRPDCLFVAPGELEPESALVVAQIARQEGVEIRYHSNLPPTLVARLGFEQVGSSVALTVSPSGLTGFRAFLKRAIDIAVAGVGVIVAAPVLIATAVAVRFTSRGPVLYRQPRVTKGGRTFTVYKFRTMRRDGDALVGELAVDRTQPFFKLLTDPRLTTVGRILRRFSLDELPQLFNILRGDMSIVGPRPLPAEQVAENLDLLGPRHEVRAGLTGWWQIKGRADLTPEESVRLDRFYIENWSPSLDLYIILKTFGAVLARRGAY